MRTGFLLFFLVFLSCFHVGGQEESSPKTVGSVREEIAEVQRLISTSRRLHNDYQARIESAPAELKQVVAQLKAFSSEDIQEIDPTASITQIAEKIGEFSAKVKASEEEMDRLAAFETQKSQRTTRIPGILAKAKVQLETLNKEVVQSGEENPEEETAYQLALAEREALEAKIGELQAELTLYSSLSELVISEKQLASRQLGVQKNALEKWQKAFADKKAKVTELAQEKAKKLVVTYRDIPSLSVIAEHTSELAKLRSEINKKISDNKSYQKKIASQRALIFQQRTDAQKRINLLEKSKISIDVETGGLLRRQRSRIPTQQQLNAALKEGIRKSTEAEITQLGIQEELRKTPIDTAAHASRLLAEMNRDDVSPEIIEELLIEHRSALLALDKDLGVYVGGLKTSNEETRLALEEAQTYSLYLDQRLLWIPSAKRINRDSISREVESVQELFSQKKRNQWKISFFQDLKKAPLIWIFASALLVLLVLRRKRYWQVLAESADIAEKKRCLRIAPTVKALWVSFLLALPLPAFFLLFSWCIEEPSEYSKALRDGAFFLGFFGFARVLLSPRGLMVSHFSFNQKAAANVSKHLCWFHWTLPILVLLSTALLTNPLFPQSGRLVFIVMLSVITVFIHLVLFPKKRFLSKYSENRAKLIYFIAISIPIGFIIGLSLGYITSVQTIRLQTLAALATTLVVLFVGRFLLRWILVTRRKLAREQAVKKYRATLAVKDGLGKENLSELPTLEEIEANALSIVSVEEQTKRLLRVGVFGLIAFAFWNIWSPSLPALSVLDSIRFGREEITELAEQDFIPNFSTSVTGESASDPPDAIHTEEAVSGGQGDDRISLQDILSAIIVIALTIIAARNLPGLLKLFVLRRLNFKMGGDYAITTVLKYCIVVFGFLLAFAKIGITWSSVQWLAAAVTLGIGFGLQEIFANFVAGIILLFERPLRLGDVVTVGNVSGKVTQIKIRATTILQFNNRELVVPNKEFITGQLINWTLSDNTLRFELVVGVAYGSDTERVTQIFLEIMEKHPDVLDSEKPEVFFTNFGSSTLDFLLRGYVARPYKLVRVPSDLRYEIDKRFREEDIEIAFPQTDIHIRSLPVPLEGALSKEQ